MAATFARILLGYIRVSLPSSNQIHAQIQQLSPMIKGGGRLSYHQCLFASLSVPLGLQTPMQVQVHIILLQGDSGSPLVCEDDGILYVAGISSWGSRACRVYPSVYTRVSFFFTWIIDHITYNGQKQEHKIWQSLFLKWLRKRNEKH